MGVYVASSPLVRIPTSASRFVIGALSGCRERTQQPARCLEPLGQGGPGHETKAHLAGGIAEPRVKQCSDRFG